MNYNTIEDLHEREKERQREGERERETEKGGGDNTAICSHTGTRFS